VSLLSLGDAVGRQVVNPHEPSKLEMAWKRWQTLVEMAILYREISCRAQGAGVLWSMALLVPPL
jgi:hypothetical protein